MSHFAHVSYRSSAFAAALFIVGALFGYTLQSHFTQTASAGNFVREGGYEFINPLISCNISEDTPYAGFLSLKNILTDTISRLKSQKKVTRAAVYFRDLDRGYWTGVNVDDQFIPASLMKVPLLITYLHEARGNRGILDMTLYLQSGADANATESIRSPEPLPQGKTYKINTLLEAMIHQSDNNAQNLLLAHAATTTFADVFSNFNVPLEENVDQDIISPKMFSHFFRILYNATYLGQTMSQQALEMLGKTAFNDGLKRGLPDTTTVSHKFGERTQRDSTEKIIKRELHDCGIIYYPKSPYLLCVMTEGENFAELENAIGDISRASYNAVAGGLIERPLGGE